MLSEFTINAYSGTGKDAVSVTMLKALGVNQIHETISRL